MTGWLVLALVLLALAAAGAGWMVLGARQDRRAMRVWPPAGRRHYRPPTGGAPPMNLDDVPTPTDLDRATERELAEGYALHRSALVNATHQHLGPVDPPGRLRASALSCLAIGEQLVRRMLAERWETAAEALTYGAATAEVAHALGASPDVVVAGVTEWAGTYLPAERRAQVLAQLHDPDPPR
jgi:hypothetical protein